MPNVDQQNLNKNKSDITCGTSLLSRALKQNLGFFFMSDERSTAAVEAASNIDEQGHLPVEDTVVSVREPSHSS